MSKLGLRNVTGLALLAFCGIHPVGAVFAQPTPSSQTVEQREADAKASCASGDVDKGVGVLARLFVDTGDQTWVYNQGRCYQQNGRAEQAINRFREYLRRGTNIAAEDKKEVEGFIAELDAEIARRPPVEASPGPPAPAPEPAQIGTVRFSAVPTTEAASWSWQKKTGYGLLAGAGVSLVAGVIFHLQRESRAAGFIDAGCGTQDLDLRNCRSLRNDVSSAQTIMTLGYVGTAILGGAGALFLWMDAKSSGQMAGTRRKIACAPAVGGMGMTCAGWF